MAINRRMNFLNLLIALVLQTPSTDWIEHLKEVSHEERDRVIENIREKSSALVVFVADRKKPESPRLSELNAGIDPEIVENYSLYWATQRFSLYPGRFISSDEKLPFKEKLKEKLKDLNIFIVEESAPKETIYHLYLHYLQWKDGSAKRAVAIQKEVSEKFNDWKDSKKAYEDEANDSPIKAGRRMGMFHTGLEYFILRTNLISADTEWSKDWILWSESENLKISESDRKIIFRRLELNYERRSEDLELLLKDENYLSYTSAESRAAMNCPSVEKFNSDLSASIKKAQETLNQQKEFIEKETTK